MCFLLKSDHIHGTLFQRKFQSDSIFSVHLAATFIKNGHLAPSRTKKNCLVPAAMVRLSCATNASGRNHGDTGFFFFPFFYLCRSAFSLQKGHNSASPLLPTSSAFCTRLLPPHLKNKLWPIMHIQPLLLRKNSLRNTCRSESSVRKKVKDDEQCHGHLRSPK